MHIKTVNFAVVAILLVVIGFTLLYFFRVLPVDRENVSDGYWMSYYRDDDLNCIKSELDRRSIKYEIKVENDGKWLVLSDKNDYDAVMGIEANMCSPFR